VSGGLSFTSINAATLHACGRTADGRVYCWGDNANGQLGSGTTTPSTVPVAVIGPS
jgi:alpha-tubulin suppressor-like RCC1 family protein